MSKADIDLYEQNPEQYDQLQNKRTDYVSANTAFIDLAVKHIAQKEIKVADFCCGVGKNTLMLSSNFSIKKATLVDINPAFIAISKQNFANEDIETTNLIGNITEVNLPIEHDVVISMFAYHHVPNIQKATYIQKIKQALKPGGLLILGEIYSPSKESTIQYYEYLLNSIEDKDLRLEKFLKQTATSDQFEFKVSRKYANDQLQAAGFTLVDSKKVWPTEDLFEDPNIGTFVEIWRLDKID